MRSSICRQLNILYTSCLLLPITESYTNVLQVNILKCLLFKKKKINNIFLQEQLNNNI